MADRGLTPKQQKFVKRYLFHLNATKAAIESGYSKKNAKQIASQLLDKPLLQKAIQKAMDRRSKKTEIDQEWVLKRLAAVADGHLKKFAKWEGTKITLSDSDKITNEDIPALASVRTTQTKDGSFLEIKMRDNVKALELVGKHLGMFNEKGNNGDGEKEDSESFTDRFFTTLKKLKG